MALESEAASADRGTYQLVFILSLKNQSVVLGSTRLLVLVHVLRAFNILLRERN